ncbi:hypothetical protein N7481_001750 [Penicillium waksmanii]|uniref:uncharacterized protein n=1 Tax=Penicillium waksmanii TaxID=69791 RepID=UPI00254725B0|nr:uncharacterized protein N7481_001750 [Penicillium waksmanii]KAJ5994773.1 hypothetical protein N7481_001750 [Penicillium waksmanii]
MMDAMENIIQIVERDEAALAGMFRLGRNPNPDIELESTQSVGQLEGPSRTIIEFASKTDSPAIDSGSETSKPATNRGTESEYSEPTSGEPQYIPYPPLEISSSDEDTFNATHPLTSYPGSESAVFTSPVVTLPSSTTTTALTSTSSSSTTTTSSTSSSSSSKTTTTQSVPTEAPTDTTDTAASNSLSSTNTKLAIAVPIAIVGLLIIAALTYFFLRRRRRRNAQPEYNIATGQTRALSTAELMALQKIEGSSSMHHLPVIQVPQYQERAPSPGFATARTVFDDLHTELGLPVAVPLDQRQSVSEHDLPRFSGSASQDIDA